MERLETLPYVVILDVSPCADDGLLFIPALREIYAKRMTDLPGILMCSV